MTSNAITSNTLPHAGTPRERKANALVRALPTIARLVLGLFLLASGGAGLLHLMPPPPPGLPAAAVAFNTGMLQSGYMFPLVAGTQALVGALLLLNRFVPLALTLLAPFVVNALAFHVFLVPAGLPAAGVLLALELYLAWTYRDAFRPMLAARVTPNR